MQAVERALRAERTPSGLHEHLLAVVRDLGVPFTARVLDIGCGSGAWLLRLQRSGFSRLTGLDLVVPDKIPGIEIRQFDIDGEEASTLGKYELVTAIEIIEHLENLGRLFELLRTILVPGGIAIITTPNIESLRARLRALISGATPSFDDKSDPSHLLPILNRSMTRLAARHKLEIIRTLPYPADPGASVIFSRPVRLLARMLCWFVPDPLPGDNTIYFIRPSSGGGA